MDVGRAGNKGLVFYTGGRPNGAAVGSVGVARVLVAVACNPGVRFGRTATALAAEPSGLGQPASVAAGIERGGQLQHVRWSASRCGGAMHSTAV